MHGLERDQTMPMSVATSKQSPRERQIERERESEHTKPEIKKIGHRGAGFIAQKIMFFEVVC